MAATAALTLALAMPAAAQSSFDVARVGIGNVAAAGTPAQSDFQGAFTGRIDALDVSSNVLASFGFSGDSDRRGDGSTVFAGISSSLGDIRGIRFVGLTASRHPNQFAINQVSVNNVPTNVVPEPGTYALMATGLVGLVALRRRAR
ncbi:MAG: PEP-CTERM sorting domain-containing protein [Gemmatimonadales bacterium]|nr:PEP-CTERM sorting domain-containing protein [Gemmatimonadales bacterium]